MTLAVLLLACLSYCVLAGEYPPSAPAAPATDKLAAATDEQISQAAKDAYVIVVAQVGDTPLGLGDRTIFDPAVQKKPTILHDAHHVTVDKTLKGADLAGLDLLVDPMTSFDLQKGKCYVLFLAPAQGQDRTCFKLMQMFYPAQPLLLEASDENITAVKKAVAAQGSQVQAKRPIYMERVKAGYLVHRFVLLDDGTFTCLSRAPGLPGGVPREPDTLVGKATKDEVKSLAKSVHDAFEAENVRLAGSAAGPGPAKTGTAADFEFVDDENKLEHKLFSDPSVAPASSVLAAVDKLVADKGNAPEETASPASAPATQTSQPASKPAEISQENARKIAEDLMTKRKMDPSAFEYHGTSLYTDADGKKFWRVSWGPKQPPHVAGQPRVMISGGQVIVLVAVDTGDTKMLFGR